MISQLKLKPRMRTSTQTGLAALLVLTRKLPVLARNCFLPNGNNSRKLGYVPCGTEDGPHSACCGAGDGCSTSGLCQGNAGYMYRGGCTDSNWEAEQCASLCQNSKYICHKLLGFGRIYHELTNRRRRRHFQ